MFNIPNIPNNLNKDQFRADQRIKSSSASGDVWIPCKSKTYSGLPYYFNRATGEAVWSMDFEKHRGKQQENIDKGTIHTNNYPEPKVPPNSKYLGKPQSSLEPPSLSHICNKQVNNQFPKHAPPSFGDSAFTSYLYNEIPQKYALYLPPADDVPHNSNIWLVPPTSQYSMGPSVPHKQSMIISADDVPHNPNIWLVPPTSQYSTGPSVSHKQSMIISADNVPHNPNIGPIPPTSQYSMGPSVPRKQSMIIPGNDVPHNPNVLPVPSTSQYSVGPSVPSKQSIIIPNEYFNKNNQILVQSTSLSISDRFKNINRMIMVSKSDNSKPYIGKGSKFTQRSISPVACTDPSTKLPANDLRFTLVARRRKSCEVLECPEVLYDNEDDSEDHDYNDYNHPESQLNCDENILWKMKNLNIVRSQRAEHNFTEIPAVRKRVTFEDSDSERVDTEDETFDDDSADKSGWVVEEFDLQSIPPKRDVSRLIQLAKANVRKDVWYIVVDTCVLLSNLVFVNVLVKSDDQCRMMVPYRVYNEIEAQSASVARCRSQHAFAMAKRACRYLEYELDVCTSVVGQLESKAEDRNIDCPAGDDDIINCCLQLIHQNYHVILLTNDESLCMKASICNIQNFTVQRIKEYLSGNEPDKAFLSPTPLTITIENNNNFQSSDIVIKKPKILCHTLNENHIFNKNEYISLESNNYNSAPSFASCTNFKNQPEKRSIDGDSTKDAKWIQPRNTFLNVKRDDHGSSMEKKSIVLNNTTNYTFKRRQIRLNRSVTNNKNSNDNIQFNKDVGSEKRPFKWRRRNSTNIDKLKTISKQDDKPNTKVDIVNLPVKNKPLKSNDSDNLQETNIVRLNDDSTSKHICTSEVLDSIFSEFNDTNSDNLIIDDTLEPSSITRENMTNDSSMHINNNFINSISARFPDRDDWANEEETNTRNNNTKKKNNEHSNKTPVNETFAFVIRDSIMEEKLKMGCEEWLSIYMQIMEEVLTQVLRLNPLTSNIELLPPPWTLPEATECIQRKYKYNFKISNNANNLSLILSKISDRSGKIASNLGPAQYMELFNSGCSLVEALKETSPDSEDIQAAKASLDKLLRDIRDPNNLGFDVDVTGAIQDIITQERDSANNTNFQYSNSNNTVVNQQSSVKNQTSQQDAQTCSRLLNLNHEGMNKANNKSYDLPDASKRSKNSVDFINQVKLTNLKQSIVIPNNNVVEKESHQNVPNKNINFVDTSIIQPKIIRNFKGIADFENRLKQKHSFNFDELVYTDFDEIEEYDYDLEEEAEDGEIEYSPEDENVMEDLKIESHSNDTRSTNNDGKIEETLNFKIQMHVNQEPDNYRKIESFIWNFLDEFKDTCLQVYSYCEETQKELGHFDTMSSSRKEEIYLQTENTYTHMNNLTRHLKGILCRETGKNNSNLDSLLKNTGLGNDENFSTYRDIIVKCIDQATIFLEVLTDIINLNIMDFK